MKFGNWPPFRGAKKEDETASVEEKFVPTERPEAISLDVVGSQPKEAAEQVSSYINGLSEYATQNNIYTSEEKRALFSAGTEVEALARQAITATNPYEKEKFEGRLKALVEKINGPLTENLVKTIKDNVETYQKVTDATRIEKDKTLRAAVGNLGLFEAEGDKRREARAQAFAEKSGIATIREEMLLAEGEYALAIEEQYRNNLSLRALGKEINLGKKVPKDIQERYNASRIAWREALATAVESADPQEKILAKFIGVRDTALRTTEIANAARERAMGEKEKGLLSKGMGYAKTGALAVLKAYNKPFQMLGESAAEIHGHFTKNEEFDREQAAKNYARAARIVGSAIIGTIASAGVAGIASAPLIFRIARGTIGVSAGSSAGAVSGKFYQRFFVSKNKEDLRSALKDMGAIGVSGAKALKAEQKKLVKGSRKVNEDTQKSIEILSAFLVGGAASIGVGASVHEFGFDKVPAVHTAGTNLENAHAKLVAPPDADAQQAPQLDKHDVKAPPVEQTSTTPVAEPAKVDVEPKHAPVHHEAVHPAEKTPASIAEEVEEHRPMTAEEAGMPESAPTPEQPVVIHPLTAEEAGVSEQEFSKSYTEPQGAVEQPAPQSAPESAPITPSEHVEPSSGSSVEHIEQTSVPSEPLETEPSMAPAQIEPAPVDSTIEAPVHTVPLAPVEVHVDSEPVPADVSVDHAIDHTQGVEAPAEIHSAPAADLPVQPTPSTSPSFDTSTSHSVEANQPTSSVESSPATVNANPDILTNKFNLEINKTVPHAYSFPGADGKPVVAIYGGSDEKVLSAAQQYLKTHPGSTIRIRVPETDILLGTKHYSTLEFSSDEQGLVLPDFDSTSALPDIDPQAFRSQIDFTYRVK